MAAAPRIGAVLSPLAPGLEALTGDTMKAATVSHSEPDTTWRGLMAAVIVQAVQDAREGDLDAMLFFIGDDFPIFAEAVGLPDLDGPQLIARGNHKRIDLACLMRAFHKQAINRQEL